MIKVQVSLQPSHGFRQATPGPQASRHQAALLTDTECRRAVHTNPQCLTASCRSRIEVASLISVLASLDFQTGTLELDHASPRAQMLAACTDLNLNSFIIAPEKSPQMSSTSQSGSAQAEFRVASGLRAHSDRSGDFEMTLASNVAPFRVWHPRTNSSRVRGWSSWLKLPAMVEIVNNHAQCLQGMLRVVSNCRF